MAGRKGHFTVVLPDYSGAYREYSHIRGREF
jgi:hypothetical protein